MKNLSLASASLLFVPWRCSALATCHLQFLVTMASVLTEGQQQMLLQQVRRNILLVQSSRSSLETKCSNRGSMEKHHSYCGTYRFEKKYAKTILCDFCAAARNLKNCGAVSGTLAGFDLGMLSPGFTSYTWPGGFCSTGG